MWHVRIFTIITTGAIIWAVVHLTTTVSDVPHLHTLTRRQEKQHGCPHRCYHSLRRAREDCRRVKLPHCGVKKCFRKYGDGRKKALRKAHRKRSLAFPDVFGKRRRGFTCRRVRHVKNHRRLPLYRPFVGLPPSPEAAPPTRTIITTVPSTTNSGVPFPSTDKQRKASRTKVNSVSVATLLVTNKNMVTSTHADFTTSKELIGTPGTRERLVSGHEMNHMAVTADEIPRVFQTYLIPTAMTSHITDKVGTPTGTIHPSITTSWGSDTTTVTSSLIATRPLGVGRNVAKGGLATTSTNTIPTQTHTVDLLTTPQAHIGTIQRTPVSAPPSVTTISHLKAGSLFSTTALTVGTTSTSLAYFRNSVVPTIPTFIYTYFPPTITPPLFESRATTDAVGSMGESGRMISTGTSSQTARAQQGMEGSDEIHDTTTTMKPKSSTKRKGTLDSGRRSA